MEKNQTTMPAEIIGFDLGHAETVATKTMLGATKVPEILEIQGDSDPTITAVATDREGRVLIGESAYRSRNLKSLRVMFKSPNLDDPEIRTPLQLFVQKIVTLWLDDKYIKGGNDSLFVVGCPSGWNDQTRAAYTALLCDAGMKQVKVERESRGAFLAARESGQVSASGEPRQVSVDTLSGSVLIVDMGSSTTDFTHIANLEEKPEDFGSNVLGAGIIDRIIFKRWCSAQDNAADTTTMFKEFPYLEAVCLLHCRKLKEKYFKTDRTDEVPVYLDERISFEGKTILFSMELLDSDMDEIISTPIGEFLQQPNVDLRKLGWQDAFRKILQDAQKQTADDPPQLILLTGGASRMSFVLKCCEEVFPSAEVVRGTEPQYTIARGLALAGRVGNKMGKFRSDIRDILASDKLQKVLREEPEKDEGSPLGYLMAGIARFVVYKLSYNIILPAFIEWREGRISTLNRLERKIKERTQSFFEGLSGAGSQELEDEVVKPWLEEYVKPAIERLTKPICDEAGIPATELSLSPDFALPPVNVAGPSDSVDALDGINTLGTMSVVIGSIIIATLLGGGGTALLFAGPIGWIIGLVIGVVATFVGKEMAMDTIEDSDVWVWVRKMMISEETVQEKLEEKEEELFDQIFGALQEKAAAFDDLLEGIAKGTEADLKEKADKAAMLIK